MFHLLSLHAVDSVAARFDMLSLSQQSLMELFVENLQDVAIAKGSDGEFLPIEDWSILSFDADGNVNEIQMDERFIENDGDLFASEEEDRSIEDGCFDLDGTIDFQYVPSTVVALCISKMEFEGTLETDQLPDGLEWLTLNDNKLTGEFRVEGLPKKIHTVNISANKFCGELRVDCIPPEVQHFEVWGNQFSGGVDLSRLPPKLAMLDISRNKLQGQIKILNPPETLKTVILHKNNFDANVPMVLDKDHNLRFCRLDSRFRGQVVLTDGAPLGEKGFVFD